MSGITGEALRQYLDAEGLLAGADQLAADLEASNIPTTAAEVSAALNLLFRRGFDVEQDEYKVKLQGTICQLELQVAALHHRLRWRFLPDEPPEASVLVSLALGPGGCVSTGEFIGEKWYIYSSIGMAELKVAPTHWRPLDLPGEES